MKELVVLIYEERLKNDYSLARHQIRLWWHTVTINICKQREAEKFFSLVQWGSMLYKMEKVSTWHKCPSFWIFSLNLLAVFFLEK